MKDPEKIGRTEQVGEDLDDMMVEAGDDLSKLEALLEFFEKMIAIAEPFTNKKSGQISAPENRLPIEKLPLPLQNKINAIDGAFMESLSYTEWIQILQKAAQRIKEKLDTIKNFKCELK